MFIFFQKVYICFINEILENFLSLNLDFKMGGNLKYIGIIIIAVIIISCFIYIGTGKDASNIPKPFDSVEKRVEQ